MRPLTASMHASTEVQRRPVVSVDTRERSRSVLRLPLSPGELGGVFMRYPVLEGKRYGLGKQAAYCSLLDG